MRKSFSQVQAKAIYKEFLNSGQTKVDFCKDRKISESTLYKWQRQLDSANSSNTTPLKEIFITPPDSKIAKPRKKLEPMQMVLVNGVKINIPPNFCISSLKLILQTLEQSHA